MKALNLYAGISGNRKLWKDVDVTAVEYKPEIANIYRELFPDDSVIVGDAHTYLLEHYQEYDFVWSSPPCPTHSRFNLPLKKKRYPDMSLYQQIILLKHFYKGKYCIENVVSYYEPLIKPRLFDGHYYWCNFHIKTNGTKRDINRMNNQQMANERGYDLEYLQSKLKDNNAVRLALRNCVLPESGLYIMSEATNNFPPIQTGLFAQ